jgi:hypothetical protein
MNPLPSVRLCSVLNQKAAIALNPVDTDPLLYPAGNAVNKTEFVAPVFGEYQ